MDAVKVSTRNKSRISCSRWLVSIKNVPLCSEEDLYSFIVSSLGDLGLSSDKLVNVEFIGSGALIEVEDESGAQNLLVLQSIIFEGTSLLFEAYRDENHAVIKECDPNNAMVGNKDCSDNFFDIDVPSPGGSGFINDPNYGEKSTFYDADYCPPSSLDSTGDKDKTYAGINEFDSNNEMTGDKDRSDNFFDFEVSSTGGSGYINDINYGEKSTFYDADYRPTPSLDSPGDKECRSTSSGLREDSKAFAQPANVTVFIEKLISHSSVIPTVLWTNDTWEDISQYLRARGINASSASCRTKKRYLDDYFRRQKKSGSKTWRHYRTMEQLHAVRSCSTNNEALMSERTVHADSPSPVPAPSNTDCVTFTKGHKWYHTAIVGLISEWGERKSRFEDDRTRHEKLWREISVALCVDGHMFSPSQCELKIKDLKDTLKNIVDDESKTGRGRAKFWPYYDMMYLYCGRSATIHPHSVFSVGVESRHSINRENKAANFTPRSKGKNALKERRVAAAEGIVNVSRDMTNMYEQRTNVLERCLNSK